jgi:hypothetical protein
MNSAIEQVLYVLNNPPGQKPGARAHLIQLITEWQAARSVPSERPVLFKMKLPSGSPSIKEIQRDLRTTISPAGSGAYFAINYSPGGPGRGWTDWELAWDLFIKLLTAPDNERERFGGPCPAVIRGALCGKYFLRVGFKEKHFCSRECGSTMSALVSTKRTREERHLDNLARADASIVRAKIQRMVGPRKGGKNMFAVRTQKSPRRPSPVGLIAAICKSR